MSAAGGRNLLAAVAGQVAGATGGWAALVGAQSYAVYTLHAGAAAMAGVALAWGVPPVLVARGAGRLIAVRGPRAVGLMAALGSAGVSVVAAAGLRGGLPVLLVCMTALGVLRAGALPAGDLLPAALGAAPAIGSAAMAYTTALPVAIGPAVAGLLLVHGGAAAVFAAVVVANLLAAAGIAAAGKGGAGRGIRVANPTAPAARRIIGATAVIWLSYGSLAVWEPLYVREVLHRGAAVYAGLAALYGLAALVVCLLVSYLPGLLARPVVLVAAAVGIGVGQVVYVGTAHLAVAIVGDLMWGAANTLYVAAGRTRLLLVTLPVSAAAVMTWWRGAQSGGQLAATVGAGAAGAAVGIQPTLIAGGLVAAGAAVWLRTPHLTWTRQRGAHARPRGHDR